MSEHFLVDQEKNGVCTITLNRPDVHNAFNDEMIKGLTDEFLRINDDEHVRLVVLKGEGKSFCAGADLNWMKRMKDYTREENYLDSQALAQMFEAMDLLSRPLIGVVHGAVLGGGTGIVGACDYVIAEEKTSFGFTEVRLGLVPAVISPYVIHKIGYSNARAFFLSGTKFGAQKALEMGLVHQVSLASDFAEDVQTCIKSFLKAAPLAQREAKRLIRGVRDLSYYGDEKVRDFTCQTISTIRVSDEGQEGMSALLEKRKPKWLG